MNDFWLNAVIALVVASISASVIVGSYWQHEEAMAKIEQGCKP